MRGSVLIMDSDRDFLRSLQNDPAFSSFPALLVSTGHEAQDALLNSNLCFAAIFIHPLLGHPGGIRMIHLTHKLRPGTPIYLLNSPALPVMSDEELHRIAVHGMVNKPITYSEILKRFISVHSYESLEKFSAGTSTPLSHQEYLPVLASEFLSGKKSFFDIYLASPDQRFLKLCEANDTFSPERAQNYIQQGVTHFYFKKTSHENCLSYCDLLGRRILKSKSASSSLRISQIVSNGSDLLEKIRLQGMNVHNMDYAMDFTKDVLFFIRQQEGEKSKLIHQYLKDIALVDHVLGTTLVAALLCIPLQLASDTAVTTVGLAALLHDIGLNSLPSHLHSENRELFSAEDQRIFDQHPDIGAKILSAFSGIHPTVIQAVAQHHKRRDSGGKNRVAEIVGLSDEYVRQLALPNMNPDFYQGFSAPVVAALRQMFKF